MIVALVIIAGIVYIIFFHKFSNSSVQTDQRPVAQEPVQNSQKAQEDQPKQKADVQSAPVSKKAEITRDDLARMASAFAERFGSFSNQSDYGNIRDLQIFMTASMKAWSEDYIASARAKKTQTAIYYGIAAKAVSSRVNLFDDDAGLAEILVKTQRRESAGASANNSVFYQDIIVKYARVSGVWLVSGAFWQDR